MTDVFLHAVFALILTSIVISGALLLIVKLRMAKNEKTYRHQLIAPSGASLSHGMVRRDNKRGVKPDSQPSLSWYSRLFD